MAMEHVDIKLDFSPEISPAQCMEIWKTKPHTAAMKLVARVISLPEFDNHARTTIWVEFLYQILLFGKENKLTATKALAFFKVVLATNAAAVERADTGTMCRQSCLRFFADELLSTTKALPSAERFTVPEVKLMTDFFKNVYVPAIKLHQYVFTREQVERQMNSELFVHTPAEPPPLSAAVDNALAPAAEPTAAEHKSPESELPAENVQPEASGADDVPPPDTDLLDDSSELAVAVAANVERQVAAMKTRMEQDYAAQEQAMLQRIATLESKLTSKGAK